MRVTLYGRDFQSYELFEEVLKQLRIASDEWDNVEEITLEVESFEITG